jgi:hypothetical protein
MMYGDDDPDSLGCFNSGVDDNEVAAALRIQQEQEVAAALRIQRVFRGHLERARLGVLGAGGRGRDRGITCTAWLWSDPLQRFVCNSCKKNATRCTAWQWSETSALFGTKRLICEGWTSCKLKLQGSMCHRCLDYVVELTLPKKLTLKPKKPVEIAWGSSSPIDREQLITVVASTCGVERRSVTIKEIEKIKPKQERNAKLQPTDLARRHLHQNYVAVIEVEANTSEDARDVLLRITRARHKSVFKDYNFRFEREGGKVARDAGWWVWIGTERSDPYFPGSANTSNNQNRMRGWVKSTIADSHWLSFVDVHESRSEADSPGKVQRLPQDCPPPPPHTSEQFQIPSIPRSTQSPAGQNTLMEGMAVRREAQGSGTAGARQSSPTSSTPDSTCDGSFLASDSTSDGTLSPARRELRRELLEELRRAWEKRTWPMDAVCLRLYFDKEKDYFRQKIGFRQTEAEIGLINDSFVRDDIRHAMVLHIANLLPHPQHPEIDDVYKVLNFFVTKCLKIEGAHLERWDIYYRNLSQGNPSTFLDWFDGYIRNWIELNSAVPSSSMGIFFRVPNWLAPLVKFILEHDTGVQDELLRVGYRSFAWLNGSRGRGIGAVSTLDGDTRAAGSFSVFCGYNIRDCPECVGDGISFLGCGISEQQRYLTEQLSHQFHARAAGFHVVEEEEEEGARDDLPLPSSILSPSQGSTQGSTASTICNDLQIIDKKIVDNELSVLDDLPGDGNVEFMSLFNNLWRYFFSSCWQSESEAMDLLDKETYDMIFKACGSTVKGGGGGTRSTRGTRGEGGVGGCGGASQGGQSEGKVVVKKVLEDLHDFRDENGVWTSDWVLQVTVKQHDGKDDADGERIDASRITKGPNSRLYSVDPELLIRVTVRNLSPTHDISLMPVYVSPCMYESVIEIKNYSSAKEGSCSVCFSDWKAGDEARTLSCRHQFHPRCIDRWFQHKKNELQTCPICRSHDAPPVIEDAEIEEAEDLVELKSGQFFELPFPLQKEAGEKKDGWVIKDKEGKTVLKLGFSVQVEEFLVEKNKTLRQINGGQHLNKSARLEQNNRLVLPMPAGVYGYLCVSVCIYMHISYIIYHIYIYMYIIYIYYIHL